MISVKDGEGKFIGTGFKSTRSFDLDEINHAWVAYRTGQMKEALVKGEKVYLDLKDSMPQGATSAQIVPIRKAMGFPEFLESKWTR